MSSHIVTIPKIKVDPEILDQLLTQTEEEGQVILHFLFRSMTPWGAAIRIWPTTYLFDCDSDHRSDLVHVENITLFPEWMEVQPFGRRFFTLVFSGLPRSCARFDFEEVCEGGGGEFVARNILRNESDVYYLEIA